MSDHSAKHADPPPAPSVSPFTATAANLSAPADSYSFPSAAAWQSAPPVHFSADWRGENADPQRSTAVRLLWTPATLYLKFVCRFRTITVFDDSASQGRRDHLWDRDVAEVFLQPDPSQPRRYKEFEVSPNGFWIDLAINLDNDALQDLRSGLHRRVTVDHSANTWTAELAIPMTALVQHFDPQATWRVNFIALKVRPSRASTRRGVPQKLRSPTSMSRRFSVI